MVRAWAGHYDMCLLDHNAVIGRHPDISNLVIAAGFSGHGVQHGPATGRAVSELIRFDEYRTLDLTPLGYERVRRQPSDVGTGGVPISVRADDHSRSVEPATAVAEADIQPDDPSC